MKKLITVLLPLFLYFFSFSQDLVIKSGSKGLYLEHKVAPKEGLFPIGRMYNVHPRHIASFNGIDFNKGLAIGQQINIPLSDTNFSQKVNSGIPVYYKTIDKESVANISVKNNVQIASLRSWNDLQSDNVTPGTKLIIGFLITNEMQDKVVTIKPKNLQSEPSVSNVSKTEEQKKQMENGAKKDEAAKIPDAEISVSNVNKAEEQKKQMDPEIKREEPPKIEEKKIDPPVVKEETKKTEPITKQPETLKDDGTGYFKTNFYQQVRTSPLTKDQTLTSSIFKTTSGWHDGKYYMLINGVEPGTIIKLTNPSNSKTIYAKVLYSMDKIRENQGVDIRISDAAAASLAVNETDKFILKVNY